MKRRALSIIGAILAIVVVAFAVVVIQQERTAYPEMAPASLRSVRNGCPHSGRHPGMSGHLDTPASASKVWGAEGWARSLRR